MRILITGGFGFIGGRLGKYLQHMGHQVVLGSRRASRIPNWLPNAEIVKTVWHDAIALKKICINIDIVIHAAGMNAEDSVNDPLGAFELNGLATGRLFLAAKKAKVKRFIFLSTAHVYAKPLIGKIDENTCLRNLHPYATSNVAGENIVLADSQITGLESIILRLSNAFGAPVYKDVNCWMLLVNDLCRQAVHSGKMILKTCGLIHRDFISISQVCKVIEKVSSPNCRFTAPAIFNVGAGVSKSILEMSQLVKRRCKSVLGFEPELIRGSIGKEIEEEKLNFTTNKLCMTFPIMEDYTNEIDDLLSFSLKHFK